jgi:tetratricopeptide (TPR) repeat protein
MFELKPISRDAIPVALEKAERYRLLNEPAQAESICLDILRIDPDNQKALVMMLLALTDQLGSGGAATRARAVVSRLKGEYERAYYTGIICERSARASFDNGAPGAAFSSYDLFREAMEWYEKAEALRSPGNDDAVLRWNTCVRTLQKNPSLRPRPEESFEPVLGE